MEKHTRLPLRAQPTKISFFNDELPEMMPLLG
jgi:hypothetical protein